MGILCLGLNGGPDFQHNEAFSFQVATADQAETDRYWNAIVGNGGEESACGWCKDKWGLSWQITPLVLTKAITEFVYGMFTPVLHAAGIRIRQSACDHAAQVDPEYLRYGS
jgi:predicted 3-demethylubiquinone-9 3-methyltransferase (glyoxalase superfamily)